MPHIQRVRDMMNVPAGKRGDGLAEEYFIDIYFPFCAEPGIKRTIHYLAFHNADIFRQKCVESFLKGFGSDFYFQVEIGG